MVLVRRFLGTIVLASPVVIMASVISNVLVVTSPDGRQGFDIFLEARWTELRTGHVSIDLAIAVTLVVMIAAWLRVVMVAITAARSSESNATARRPLVRLVLRLLVLTPLTLQPQVHRVAATTHSDIVDKAVPEQMNAMVHEALLVSVAVVVGLSWRLRHRRRLALVRSDATNVPNDHLAFESSAVAAGERIMRVDLAVRSLIHARVASIVWLIHHRSGSIHVQLHEAQFGGVEPSAPWIRVGSNVHLLDASVSTESLTSVQGSSESRLPLIVPVGTSGAGEVWVNLEALESFSVSGRDEEADAVWNGLCHSIALSPLHRQVTLIGWQDHGVQGCRQVVTADPSSARTVARTLHSTQTPSVVLIDEPSGRSLRVEESSPARAARLPGHGLERRHGVWMLLPLESPIEPVSCTQPDRERIRSLLGHKDRVGTALVEPVRPRRTFDEHPVVADMMSECSFIVRVMGSPYVEHLDGDRIDFDRHRSEELVVWLSLHPDRRRRAAARADIWNAPVKDSTFSNITSDVRRSLTARELPPPGQQWLGITMTEDLPLHERIVTDAFLLERCFEYARRHPDDGARQVLAVGLGFVRGIPFENCSYILPDGIGLSTNVAMLIVRAATMFAESAVDDGDCDAAYWGTAKGLAAVPGHEGLVAIRMRLHAANGDRAALVAEWESYCRALTNDDWGDMEPSPKMVDLWFELSGRRGMGRRSSVV